MHCPLTTTLQSPSRCFAGWYSPASCPHLLYPATEFHRLPKSQKDIGKLGFRLQKQRQEPCQGLSRIQDRFQSPLPCCQTAALQTSQRPTPAPRQGFSEQIAHFEKIQSRPPDDPKDMAVEGLDQAVTGQVSGSHTIVYQSTGCFQCHGRTALKTTRCLYRQETWNLLEMTIGSRYLSSIKRFIESRTLPALLQITM